MIIRPATKEGDIKFCCDLVEQNWGNEPANRCLTQMVESLNDTPYSPRFFIADIGDPLSRDYAPYPIGFSAYQPSMKMKGSYDFIWIAVDKKHQGHLAGTALTDHRIADIRKRGGQMIELVTQKPAFFSRFGFFKLHHIGNEWYLMLKLLTSNVDI